jgi:hypothetical protein
MSILTFLADGQRRLDSTASPTLAAKPPEVRPKAVMTVLLWPCYLSLKPLILQAVATSVNQDG